MARDKSKMPPPPQAVVEDHPELLEAPVNDLDGQPELEAASEDMPEEVVIPKPVSRRKLKVVATRAGFIHQERKVEGSRFEVMEHELGSWMDVEDPVEQKKHLARIAEKKKRANRKAVADDKREIAADE